MPDILIKLDRYDAKNGSIGPCEDASTSCGEAMVVSQIGYTTRREMNLFGASKVRAEFYYNGVMYDVTARVSVAPYFVNFVPTMNTGAGEGNWKLNNTRYTDLALLIAHGRFRLAQKVPTAAMEIWAGETQETAQPILTVLRPEYFDRSVLPNVGSSEKPYSIDAFLCYRKKGVWFIRENGISAYYEIPKDGAREWDKRLYHAQEDREKAADRAK